MRTTQQQIKNLIANIEKHGNIGKFLYQNTPNKTTQYNFEKGSAYTLNDLKAFSNIMQLNY